MIGANTPLHGLRVLDLSRVLSGPYVGRMLADLGADVVKVEAPDGDVTRRWGKQEAGLAGYYLQQNVGKRNVCVDLQAEGGASLLRSLACVADVLVENFRPGVMARHGLDYPSLSADNPRLVMLSITGFGQTGPEAHRPAYAAVTHAEAGVLDRQAAHERRAPRDFLVSMADMNAALHGLVGVLSAVVMRARTGLGQHVDIAMLDAMLATDDHINSALDGLPPPHGIASGVWEVCDGHIALAGDFRWIWRQLSTVHGVVDPTPEGADLPTKIRCRREAVAAWLRAQPTRAALHRALDRAELVYGDIKSSAEAVDSPTARHHGARAEVADWRGGTRPVIQSPYRFSGADSGAGAEGAPRRGAHNRAVLCDWLGMPEQRIAELSERGVLLAE